MKTPEQMAEEYAFHKYIPNTKQSSCGVEDFLAGFKAGREMSDQEIVDFLVDIREREARERNKRSALQQQRHDRIWERFKVTIKGILP